jgi:hypothetical protein
MRNFKSYQVQPNIPGNLTFLETLSRNMWWCWTRDAVELFRRIDPRLWAECGRNPVPFLNRVPQTRLDLAIPADPGGPTRTTSVNDTSRRPGRTRPPSRTRRRQP